MSNILFVHGTGVRQPSYDETFATITTHSAKHLRDCTLHRCYWGGTEGSRLGLNGASIPDYDTARAIADVAPEDVAIARWSLLYADSDAELDAFLTSGSTRGGYSPGAETPLETITGLLQIETQATHALEEQLGLQAVWEKAKAQVLAALSAASDNNRVVSEIDAEFRAALARSRIGPVIGPVEPSVMLW